MRKRCNFMKRMLFRGLMALALVTALTGFFAGRSLAADYNPGAALSYAAQHWADTPDISGSDCANFVSKCIGAGGCPASSASSTYLRNALLKSGMGTAYDLALTKVNGSYQIRASDYQDRLAPGDVVFFYCSNAVPSHNGRQYIHTILCNGMDENGWMKAYSHTGANNGQAAYRYSTKCWVCGQYTVTSASVFHFSNPHAPGGYLDELHGAYGSISVKGWAYDPDAPGDSIEVHVYIGDTASGTAEGHALAANQARPDVYEVLGIPGDHGYEQTIATSKTGVQQVTVYAINVGDGSNTVIAQQTVDIPDVTRPDTYLDGYVDSVQGGRGTVSLRGWAYDRGETDRSMEIHVYIGDTESGNAEGHILHTDVYREDVNSTFGISGNHGYEATVETAKTGTQPVTIFAIGKDRDYHKLLGQTSVTIPAAKPTVTPTPSPKPTVTPAPSPKPTVTPQPSPKPTPKPSPAPAPVSGSFTDVPSGAYYAGAVGWAVAQGVTKGTSKTTFGPGETCTRAQVVTFLWRGAGSPAPASKRSPFSDVSPGAYYYEAVLWAVEQDITKGTSADAFSPEEACTRGQVVTFLHRFEDAPAPASSRNPFADVSAGAYYYDPVRWAVEREITKGTSETTFGPGETCTRGQIVTFLYRDLTGAK